MTLEKYYNSKFYIIINKKNKEKTSVFFKDINWKQQQLELLEELKKIKPDNWIEIFGVELDKNDNVIEIEFRITPKEDTSHYQYVHICFDKKGNIKDNSYGDLEFEKWYIKQEDYLEPTFEEVETYYKVLIDLESKQKKYKQ
ncbi:MAG: hypothetical protein SPLM_10510 [Spiroplasma phoeniceum]|uniref:hypothetical protein n=1 Tax=Spiroplasma phoeniceum TaxID=47835 RepID=UPI00313402D0